MNTPNSLSEIWAKKTDEQLFDALAHSSDYNPAAIEAVKKEIGKRNLSSQSTSILEENSIKEKDKEEIKSQLPLQWVLRILMLIFAFGIPQAFLAEHFRNTGFIRRANETWRWMVYGVILWIAFFLIRLIL